MVKNGNPRKKGLVKLVYHLSDSLCKYLMIPVFNIGRTFFTNHFPHIVTVKVCITHFPSVKEYFMSSI